ncbi:hypothetical protein [Eudoraea adriatica]|uniref:hypothetical protein n=1 Tax=Eudoraea adriatica TaxID=446681 RepID=UPI00036EAC9F|nr:hypothetical protein [Eudoraea adriatica]
MNIKSYLRKKGYRPELSDGKFDKYEKVLQNYLKDDRYWQFCSLRESGASENELLEFIGKDEKLLKIVISSQIQISISILENIIDIISKRIDFPNQILDLGGADGWTIDYLNNYFNWVCPLTVIDQNSSWNPINDSISIINKSYSKFNGEKKFDLIISILGAPFDHLDELFECINRSISDKGIAFLGLRIATDHQYLQVIEKLQKLELGFVAKHCKKITVFNEQIPFILLEKTNSILTINDSLMIIRKGFYNKSDPKRESGMEANILLKLIEDGSQIEVSKENWENGDWLEVEVINKNEILYRKTSNNSGDLIIEYPVSIEDEENEVHYQLERMHSEDIWNSIL